MKPALHAAFRDRVAARDALLVSLVVAAAVVSALLFDAAVHPERIHDPGHHARFVADAAVLPALAALRVRVPEDRAREAGRRAQELGTARGLFPGTVAPFRQARYLRAAPAEIAEAIATLGRGEAPVPPSAPDLSLYYRDARGPYLCDLALGPGKSVADARARLPRADLAGEPLLRETEGREAAAIARSLLLALPVAAAWLAWRRGRREMLARMLAALAVLAALGILGAGVDRAAVAGLALVAGASSGAPLLACAPCLLFPGAALHRLGLVLCLGGAIRLLLLRPALLAAPPRPAMARAAALAVALSVACHLALSAFPARVPTPAEVAAEPGALLVSPGELAATARRLRAEGLLVTGDEALLPGSPDPRRRRDLWRIFTRATSLAVLAEGEARARFEDVADAASQMSLASLPKDLRWRLRATDGRRVLWVPADGEREGLASARLYRARGERELRAGARHAAVLVALSVALAVAVLRGDARRVLRGFAVAALAAAVLLLGAPAEADRFLPLVPLAASAPALAPAIALGAAAVFLPALAWPAAAFLAAGLIRRRSPRSPTRPSC